MNPFWFRHAVVPTVGLGVAWALMAWTGADLRLADGLFDPATGSFPFREAFWTQTVLHRGGVKLVGTVGIGAILLWAAAFRWEQLRPLQRRAGYVALCFALGPGLVALGKQASNVDCPWDLQRYGGDRPHVGLLADRPDELPAGHCFPAGHSSGAFAFFAFYFVLRGSRPRAARAALHGTAALGLAFAGTQWLRGAHFPSHDLWSVWICWMTCLSLHAACLCRTASVPSPVGPQQRTTVATAS